jgi:hypothetical protein
MDIELALKENSKGLNLVDEAEEDEDDYVLAKAVFQTLKQQ